VINLGDDWSLLKSSEVYVLPCADLCTVSLYSFSDETSSERRARNMLNAHSRASSLAFSFCAGIRACSSAALWRASFSAASCSATGLAASAAGLTASSATVGRLFQKRRGIVDGRHDSGAEGRGRY
jgi:hypothetical protein